MWLGEHWDWSDPTSVGGICASASPCIVDSNFVVLKKSVPKALTESAYIINQAITI